MPIDYETLSSLIGAKGKGIYQILWSNNLGIPSNSKMFTLEQALSIAGCQKWEKVKKRSQENVKKYFADLNKQRPTTEPKQEKDKIIVYDTNSWYSKINEYDPQTWVVCQVWKRFPWGMNNPLDKTSAIVLITCIISGTNSFLFQDNLGDLWSSAIPVHKELDTQIKKQLGFRI